MKSKRTIFIFLILAVLIVVVFTLKESETPVGEAEVLQQTEVILTEESLERHMLELVSERYDGRFPGTEGNVLAAAYIREQMRDIGLISPYFAEDYYMPFSALIPIKIEKTTMSLMIGQERHDFQFGYDYVEFVTRNFAKGFGVHSDTYKLVTSQDDLYDFDGATIVVYTKEAIEGISYDELFGKIILSDERPKMVLYESNQQNSGYFVLSPYSRFVQSNDNHSGILIYKVSEKVIQKLMANPDATLTASTGVSLASTEMHNVVGMIDGNGDSGYVLMGHFDHLGNNFDGTYNPGALDNASGIATLLVLAEALVRDGHPELDYYFIAFNAEEEGLYGSEAFAGIMPLPIDRFEFINIDMVGSSAGIPVTVSATRPQSHALQSQIIDLAALHGVETISSESGSSDHVPIEHAGYRAISLTELDKRYYHTPGDTIEQSVDFGRMLQIVNWIHAFVLK